MQEPPENPGLQICSGWFIDHSMNNWSTEGRKWDGSPSASKPAFMDTPPMFQLLFERSADAIWLFDPKAGVFLDCNAAAVELMRAGTKERLLGARPEDLSPPLQPEARRAMKNPPRS